MWKRSDLKRRAKYSFKRNYWKCVLISLLFVIIVGGNAGFAFGSGDDDLLYDETTEYTIHENYEDDIDNDSAERYFSKYFEIRDKANQLGKEADEVALAVFLITMLVVFITVFLIVLAITIVLNVFLFNPLEVGCDRFYLRNLNEPAQIGNVGYAFDNNYKNITKTLFFRDLYTFLWSLLLIIPGIIKSYEYRMIPYLLAEDPQMTKEQAFAESRRMMRGQKWRAFVLDLSFLGWNILSVLTLGILGIFYVQPYMDATHAALYEMLRYGTPYSRQVNATMN